MSDSEEDSSTLNHIDQNKIGIITNKNQINKDILKYNNLLAVKSAIKLKKY